MVVFGRTKVERAGNILFTGNLDQCRGYAEKLNQSEYDMLSICEDNGVIKEKIIEYGLPVRKYRKRKVWIVTVFFTEESGLPVSEEYTADNREDIEKVKQQIRNDYSPEEIDFIMVSDEPEVREFYS